MKNLDYYNSLNYRIEVIEDKVEGGFVLSCPELKGCLTCAKTLDEGYKMILDAKKEWLVAALEDEYEIPLPASDEDFSGQFKLRIPKSLHRSLAEQSKREGISMNQYCLYLLSKNERSHAV